ncbi:VPS35 endosomal protein sorting factor-like [Episyrphus balteatus]|uniref:VPS35 endosomal protein sorting factor-like n=1 Tax=Episyrphus balteatus TaxID=286459 RepID=UPI0024869141|nr:VPS35 endosomal protein sorting factor-like [Episyrphus balteatus]
MASDWQCVPKDYEINKNILQGYFTYEHPLKQMTVVESKGTRRSGNGSLSSSRTSSTLSLIDPLGMALDGSDPLSQFARQEQELMDPLSQMATDYETSFKKTKKRDKDRQNDEEVMNWSVKRLGILNKFITSEKLSISTSFLAGGELIKAQTIVSDKVKYRLEQLDDFEDGSMRHMMNLTQQEYILRIEQLNQELVQSWNGDQRVKALKIAIQCAKMLSDTSVLQFYPSQFVLITDILDIFGKLVFERLRSKADCGEQGKRIVPEKFAHETMRENAKETCQNWFFKIASIRELLPRIYVEMAILKCYSFISQNEYGQALMRITRMIRGIGDPLVATYARCYLLRVGLTVSVEKNYIRENFNDFLAVYHTIFNGTVRSEINRQRIDITLYLSLYTPALDWILQALVKKSDEYCEEMLKKCKDTKNNGLLLISMLNSLKPEFIAANALEFVNIISNSSTEGISKGQLFRALGNNLNKCPPSIEQKEAVYNNAFTTIKTFTQPSEYITCVEMWAQFTVEHFSMRDVNNFLGEIKIRMNQNKAYENHYPQLQSILEKIVRHCKEFELLLTLDNFLPVLDLFKKESTKIDVCKQIMTTYKNNVETTTSDAVVSNALMYICKVLNDSVTALTVEDERRQIGSLISNFVKNVNYGRDFEQQLTFYVESRAAFPNLDAVITTLVHSVNKLAIETRNVINGQHTRKTAAFVKACAAYCFITIPSIASVATQMDLYLLSGQVALLNVCLGQADACFETALQLVAELPRTIEIEGKLKSTEGYLVSYLCNMLSTLIIVPDSPEQGVLYLLRLLLDVLKKFPFDLHSIGPVTVYLHALDMLYIESLDSFPYHIPNVVSNDGLYGGDLKFITEVNCMCAQIVEHILSQLKSLGFANQLKAQSTLALELLLRIIRYADVSKEKIFALAVNLWNLAIKHEGNADQKIVAMTLKCVEEVKTLTTNEVRSQKLNELLNRMKTK